MNRTSFLPFGLRFEEHPLSGDFDPPIYDEDEDISICIDEKGQKVPSVEHYWGLGTRTETKVANEGTDEDSRFSALRGTRTLTEIQNETSDSDDSFLLSLATTTATFVSSEQTDEDPGIDTDPRPPLTTRTATSVAKEDTDTD